ncbi:MAG: hypothetical protein ACO3RV_02155 [Luteolibacter sp.]
MNSSIADTLAAALEAGKILPSTHDKVLEMLACSDGELASQVIGELIDAGEWQEINDRFFKSLAFGTGGIRGRTVGRVVAPSERGQGGPNERPEHPCIGTATMNYYNLSRAVRGLIAYIQGQVGAERAPKLVFGHDTRHFSREFAEFCARVAADHGCDAWLFDGPRSTPEVSFAIRELRADSGAVITASHNPAHDNGFKVYFDDGAQIVEPHASGIINEVHAIRGEGYEPVPAEQRGRITVLGAEMDALYSERLKSLLLRPELLDHAAIRIVFTNLHGTGGHINVPMLRSLGFDVLTVPEQDIQDGRFPTVESPNPENAPALKMAIDLARKENAEIVIGTDPDADRMGVACRDDHVEMVLLTGNQIG